MKVKRMFHLWILLIIMCILTVTAVSETNNLETLIAIVNTKSSPLSMRESPSQSGKTIANIKKGETVIVLADGAWPLIEYNGKQGYVNASYQNNVI